MSEVSKDTPRELREYDFDTWCCPSCQVAVDASNGEYDTCPHCGQKLIVPWVRKPW